MLSAPLILWNQTAKEVLMEAVTSRYPQPAILSWGR
jgi:hypothetical protein